MADVRFTEGFDRYNGVTSDAGGLLQRWSQIEASTKSLVAGRIGGQALRFNASGVSGVAIRAAVESPPGPTATFEFAFRISTFALASDYPGNGATLTGNSDEEIICSLNTASMTRCVNLIFDSAGRLWAASATASGGNWKAIQLAAAALSADTWYTITMEVDITDGAGAIRVYVDHELTPRIDATGIDFLPSGGSNSIASIDLYYGIGVRDYDDISLIAGDTKLSYASYVQTRDMVADVVSDFVPLSGTDNFAMVDGLIDSATYVSGSNIGDTDKFSIDPIVDDPIAIYGASLFLYGLKTDAATRLIDLIGTSGAVDAAVNRALSVNHDPISPLILGNNPDTGVEWTKANLNASSWGYEITA